MRAWLVAAVLLAGCASSEAPAIVSDEPPPVVDPLPDVWDGQDELLVLDRTVAVGTIREFDVLCAFGGTASFDLPLERAVPKDAAALRFTISSGATTTGVQGGYETSEGLTWTPVVYLDTKTFLVEVPAGQDPSAWKFHYQLNVPAEQACYTGASLGDYAVVAHALRAG